MKNYNANFNYLLAPLVLAIGSNYFFNLKNTNKGDVLKKEINDDNSLKGCIEKIQNFNKYYADKILINRRLLCDHDKTEKIYVETLQIYQKTINLTQIILNELSFLDNNDKKTQDYFKSNLDRYISIYKNQIEIYYTDCNTIFEELNINMNKEQKIIINDIHSYIINYYKVITNFLKSFDDLLSVSLSI